MSQNIPITGLEKPACVSNIAFKSVANSIGQNLVLIKPAELAKCLGVSKITLWRWRNEHSIPQPIQLGPRMIGWRVSDIEIWLESKRPK